MRWQHAFCQTGPPLHPAGITAECALALAQVTGAQLALLDIIPPAPGTAGDEVSATLARMAAAGVRCAYYSADVTDTQAVAAVVSAVQAEQGAITAVVHGAAILK